MSYFLLMNCLTVRYEVFWLFSLVTQMEIFQWVSLLIYICGKYSAY